MARITIVIESGMVSVVCSNDPTLIGSSFEVIDYDTDGADPVDLTDIQQSSGNVVGAYHSYGEIERLQVQVLENDDAQ